MPTMSKPGLLRVALFLLLLPAAPAARAAKPTQPPPAAAGTVFFEYQGEIRQMQADGTGGGVALASDDLALMGLGIEVHPLPSSCRYDNRHWWLWIGARDGATTYPGTGALVREVFVGVPGPGGWAVQLTDFFDDPAGQALVPSGYGNSEWQILNWSNDGLDTFVSFVGYDMSESPVPPRQWYIYQLAIIAGEDGRPLGPADGWPLVTGRIPLPSNEDGSSATNHHWAPDGQTVLYQFDLGSSATSGGFAALYRHSLVEADLGFPATELWRNDRETGIFGQNLGAQWSPDLDPGTDGYQGKIVFCRFRSSIERDLLTIPATAENLVGPAGTTSILSGRYRGYSQPRWAPLDGSQIVAREVDGSKGIDVSKYPKNIVRIQGSGGSLVKLGGNLDSLALKQIVAWRHGFEAP